MRKTKLICCYLVVMLMFLVPPALPEMTAAGTLVVDGKAVDPICLLGLARANNSESISVELRKCGNEHIIIGSGSSDPAMFGFNYRVRNAQRVSDRRYLFYRLLGFYRGRPLLFIEFSQGDASNWTRIVGVNKNGDILKSETPIATGDRCNGGLFNVSVDHGHLSYDQRLSPYNLINLTDELPRLELGQKAEHSADACVAVLHVADGRWRSVRFTRTDFDRKNSGAENIAYPPCFSRIYRDYAVRRDTELDHAGVRRFVNIFVSTCMVPAFIDRADPKAAR